MRVSKRLDVLVRPRVLLVPLFCGGLLLGACQSNQQAQPVDLDQSTEQMTKTFSTPNLAVLLSDATILGKQLNVLSNEQTGTLRANQSNSVPMLQTAEFTPAKCKTLTLDSFKDDSDYPAAWADASLGGQNVVRVQLTAFSSAQKSAEAIGAQTKLAEECPEMDVSAAGAPAVHQQFAVHPWSVGGADQHARIDMTAEDSKEIGLYARVGNLDLRVFFDGPATAENAKKAQKDIADLLSRLRVALIQKS